MPMHHCANVIEYSVLLAVKKSTFCSVVDEQAPKWIMACTSAAFNCGSVDEINVCLSIKSVNDSDDKK